MTAKYTLQQRLVGYVTDGRLREARKILSVRVVPKHRRFEKDFKMAGDKNKNAIWALLLSLLALITTYNNQLVVTPDEMVGLYCRD